MKFPLLITLIWAIGSCSGRDTFGEFLLKNTRIALSNTAHAGCLIFANGVKENPIKKPTIEKVSFQLRTPCGQKEVPVSEASKLRDSPEFDANKKTIVFVTGWFVDPNISYVGDMAKAYNCRGDNNFLVVNTGGFISSWYVNSAYHTGKLGEFVAVGLQNLGVPADKIHLIGHSLGAQIVGSAGRHYSKLTGQKIQRITGLDPARPCFVTPVVFPRLAQGDAVYVDIIHSNPKDLGLEEATGDADFYPGGLNMFQSGCSSLSLFCSHENAIKYYLESVYPGNENGFMASHCDDYSALTSQTCNGQNSPMGYANDLSTRGIHFLTVKSRAPFGMAARSAVPSASCGLCPK